MSEVNLLAPIIRKIVRSATEESEARRVISDTLHCMGYCTSEGYFHMRVQRWEKSNRSIVVKLLTTEQWLRIRISIILDAAAFQAEKDAREARTGRRLLIIATVLTIAVVACWVYTHVR